VVPLSRQTTGIGSSGRGADVDARVVLRHVTGRDFSEAGCFCAWYAVGYTPAAMVSRVCWRLLMGHMYYRTVVVDAWARYASKLLMAEAEAAEADSERLVCGLHVAWLG
jgi:hypothetical protein